MGNDASLTWFLAQFRPNCQALAVRNLREQGFETFLPLLPATRRRGAKFQSVRTPLFPGYLFVAFDVLKGGWRAINSTHGVSRLVGFGSDPVVVPEDLIQGLLARCDEEGMLEPSTVLATGDRVRLTDGPFAELFGTIETVESEQRVWILIDVMGRSTRISAASGQVARLRSGVFG